MDLISKSSKNNYVISVADGVVSNTGYDSVSGYYVFVKHNNGEYSFYCHLLKGSTIVKKNQSVKKGQRLATMGNTGASQGTHLHYAVKRDGKWIDPKPSLEKADYFNVKGSHYPGEYPKLPVRGYFNKNDKGTEVKKLQKLLNWLLDAKLKIDGICGDNTLTAVGVFQKKVNLVVDKKYGKKTQAKAKNYTK